MPKSPEEKDKLLAGGTPVQPPAKIQRHEIARSIRISLISIFSEFLFVLAPFIVLLIIYLGQGRGSAIWAAPDWSLASAVLYGQTSMKLMAGVTSSKRTRPESAMLIQSLILVLGLFPSLAILYMMVDPEGPATGWQIAQVVWFVGASLTFIVIGTVGQVLVARAAEFDTKKAQ